MMKAVDAFHAQPKASTSTLEKCQKPQLCGKFHTTQALVRGPVGAEKGMIGESRNISGI
jgi:hypothetical protein